MVSSPIRFQTFAGRSTELEHLLARRADAAKGRGGVVLVAGDPGIGKSRLVREFCDRLPRRTTKIASSAYREFAQRPLAPLLDILEQIDPDSAAPVLPANAPKTEFMAALVEAFERAAGASTTVVVLEDLHWADREALEVLHALCHSAGSRRLLFVGTYRDGEIVPEHPNFSLIGRLLRESVVSLVALQPLVERDVSELLRTAVAGRWALPSGVLDGVRRRCDGNAFFAEELLRYSIDRFEAGETVTGNTMPLSVHAAVCDRLALCSPEARALLSQASLYGRAFDLSVVNEIFGAPLRASGSHAELPIDELMRHGLIERAGDRRNAYRFTHALVRESVYGEIPGHEARELHLRIASALAARPDAERHAENLAHHFWYAGDLEHAAPHCIAAAERARELHAYSDAADWYERAANAFNSDADVARALSSAAQVCVYTDQIDRAIAFYADAKDRFIRSGRFDDVVITSVLAAATMQQHGRTSDATALLESTRDRWAALATAPVRDRMLLRLGAFYAFTGNVAAAWSCLDEAEPITIATSPVAGAERLFLESNLSAQSAEAAAWRERFDRAYTLFESAGTTSDNLRIALSNAATQAVNLGEIDRAREFATRAFGIAQTILSGEDQGRILLGQIEAIAGNIAAARGWYDAAVPVERYTARIERAILESWLLVVLGEDALEHGDETRLIAEAASSGQPGAFVRLACACAEAAVYRGQEREADTLFARAAPAITTTFGTTFAIAALALHRPKRVVPIRALVAAAAERADDRVNRALLAFIDAAQAHAADPTTAARHARIAAEGFAALGMRRLEAQANELGGRRKEALQFYRSAGAVGEIRRLERGAISHTDADAVLRDSILTPRERDVARLVAAGDGNRAAAKRLSISEKAIEKCLTSIYAKLGVSTRAQLAAYVAQNGFRSKA